jgi:hypothetical protein
LAITWRATWIAWGVGLGQVLGGAGDAGVHEGAAELLLVAVLAEGRLDQRRAREEHLGLVAHGDHVVGEAWEVRAAGGR